ncbi:unnamed protein product, partial [Rotaria magnacalcarata]
EDLSDEGLPKVPNLDLAQIKFLLTIKPNDVALKEKLLNEMKLNSMASFYSECVNDGQLSSDDKLLQTMRSVNEEKIKEFD